MTHIKLFTTACLSIALLSACSPSQDKAKQQTDQPQAELDPKTQKFMQTDLSETLPEDEMPASSATAINNETLDTASIADEETEAEAMAEEEFDIRVYRAARLRTFGKSASVQRMEPMLIGSVKLRNISLL